MTHGREVLSMLMVVMMTSAVWAGGYLKLEKNFSDNPDAPKIAVIGDSYVQNHHGKIPQTWHYQLAEKYGLHYYNFGRNGNRMVFPLPKSAPVMLRRYKEIPKDVAVIVVIAGHNDAGAIGKGEEGATAEAFRKGCHAFIAALKTGYPKAKLVFVTPWAVDKPAFPAVIAAIKSETALAGVPCYDAANLSGINPNDPGFRAKYFQSKDDTAHLNPAGHKLMLEKVEPFFKPILSGLKGVQERNRLAPLRTEA